MGSDPKAVLVWLHPQGAYHLLALLVQTCSLYWYKSTKSVLVWLHPQGANNLLALLVQKYKHWRGAWYKSTNTDAEPLQGPAVLALPSHPCSGTSVPTTRLL
jgi:hypothetical protein